jgi:hypothetical protein
MQENAKQIRPHGLCFNLQAYLIGDTIFLIYKIYHIENHVDDKIIMESLLRI